MRGFAGALVAGLLAVAPGALAKDAPGRPRITGLEAKVGDDELLVSFRLRDALDPEFRERLHSGIAVRFRHRVDLIAPRAFFLVPSKLMERTVVETTLEYDSLTRQYRLHRSTRHRSRSRDRPFPPLEVRRSTGSFDEAAAWLTQLRDVPLPWQAGYSARDRLRVRVQSHLGRRVVLLVFPAATTVSAELRLEF